MSAVPAVVVIIMVRPDPRTDEADFSFASFLALAWFLPLFFVAVSCFSGVSGAAATGSGEISGPTLPLLPGRGHEKSSARPAGVFKVSPRLKTFAAIESEAVRVAWSFPPEEFAAVVAAA